MQCCLLRIADVYCGNLGGHTQMGPEGIPEKTEEYVNFSKVMLGLHPQLGGIG
jgi:hypothetical protein